MQSTYKKNRGDDGNNDNYDDYDDDGDYDNGYDYRWVSKLNYLDNV